MWARPVPLLAIVFVATAWAQTPGIPATVEGRVVNSLTGEGLGSATIRLVALRGVRATADKQSDSLQTSTQSDGGFHLDQIAPGTYVLMASREGFTLSAKASATRYLDLQPGQSANGLVLPMVPNASFTGKVLDPDGKPVPGARVVALLPSQYGNQGSYDERGSANCDKNGAFVLKGLARGRYYVAASFALPKENRADRAAKAQANPDSGTASGGIMHLVPTLYPRALALTDATLVTADPEQPSGDLTIYLQRAFTHTVKGKVGELAQGPNLVVQLSPRDFNVNSGLFAPTVTVAADRTFSFSNVVPGSYTVRLLNRRMRLLSREDIDAGSADLTGLVLNPLPQVNIHGTVAFEASGTSTALPSLTIMARPLDEQVRANNQTGHSNADGTFELQQLDPGTYSFYVLFQGGNFYLHSITFNGQDVTNRAVDLSQTGSGQMEIRIASGVGQVNGSVESDGSSDSSGHIWTILIPDTIAPDASNVRVTVAKADGTFTLPNVPPGNYQILAADQADPRLWQNPRFLQQIKAQGTSVTLAENGHEQLQLRKLPYPLLQQTAEQLGLFLE